MILKAQTYNTKIQNIIAHQKEHGCTTPAALGICRIVDDLEKSLDKEMEDMERKMKQCDDMIKLGNTLAEYDK